MSFKTVLIVYFLLINLFAFFIFWTDKKMAQQTKSKTRISEKAMFGIAALGGALGMWAGMYRLRHKTKHWYFVVFIPVILLLQIVLLLFILQK